MLNTVLKNCLMFSTYIENVTPKIIPKIVADVPIVTPTKKKFLQWIYLKHQLISELRFHVFCY